MCIVLIEDHDATREILQAVLETSGYEVHAARDGERGLDAIRAHDPNLVITDIAMPGLDGLDVVRTLQEDETFPPIPVVAATAQSSGYDPDDLKDLFSAVLRKPVDPADLIRTVEALVEKAE